MKSRAKRLVKNAGRPARRRRYGILVNPCAGCLAPAARRRLVEKTARLFGPQTLIAGWETCKPEDLKAAAREMADEVDVLVVAGGDGTFSDVINAVRPETVLSYLPMGSGNAWRNTLGLPRSMDKIAARIRDGRVHRLDLVLVNEYRKGLLASVGFEGQALSERGRLLEMGVTGLGAYFTAVTRTMFRRYKGGDSLVSLDGKQVRVREALTMIITKTPFYGYGIKVVPKARPDDGLLHVLLVSGHPAAIFSGILTAIPEGNVFGEYTTSKKARIVTDQERYLQVDGTLIGKGRNFTFRVLPGVLRMRY
jgi:diacylglycerol kinase (ATP)